ncbi:MAG TPA: SRPBCC family protein [Pyrinomonadaceae bacterium]|jgi:uncharacterized protein YndB with AHSA1/START domain
MRRYERSVEIDAPVERVFDLFADFEAAPRWAGGVREVRRTGRRTFLWVAETALDVDVEWEAEVVVFAPDRRIVWRAVGGDIRADCEAVFSATQEGTTVLRVVRGYDTPGGRTGRAVARFFGRHPEEQLEEDLLRLRRLAERPRRPSRPHDRVPGVLRAERGGRDEDPRPRHALTPRERQRERGEREREWQMRREAEQRRAAGWYLRRGVDRLLEPPPEEHDRRRRD